MECPPKQNSVRPATGFTFCRNRTLHPCFTMRLPAHASGGNYAAAVCQDTILKPALVSARLISSICAKSRVSIESFRKQLEMAMFGSECSWLTRTTLAPHFATISLTPTSWPGLSSSAICKLLLRPLVMRPL